MGRANNAAVMRRNRGGSTGEGRELRLEEDGDTPARYDVVFVSLVPLPFNTAEVSAIQRQPLMFATNWDAQRAI